MHTLGGASEGRVAKDPKIRREELLGTAFDLFMELGYEATSVQQITETAGVSKGLFYHYFQSKADLLDQVARLKSDQFLATLPPSAAAMPGTAPEKARALIDSIVGWKFGEVRGMTMTYLRVMYSDENVALRARLYREYLDRLAPLFAEIIAEGAEEGVFHVDDAEMASGLVWSLWAGDTDTMAGLLLELPGRPERVAEILRHARAWESGVERLIGADPGTLRLYDFEYLERVLGEIAEERGEVEP